MTEHVRPSLSISNSLLDNSGFYLVNGRPVSKGQEQTGSTSICQHLTVKLYFSFYQQRISHLVGLLSDGGKPVLLVGEAGCGKTSILRHRLKQHGGDIGEVLSLTVFCNKFTTSRSLWKEMSSCLEWKHARTFVPKGNKRLTCLVDDLNLSRVSVDIDSYCHLRNQK